jgi:hypothetical protein
MERMFGLAEGVLPAMMGTLVPNDPLLPPPPDMAPAPPAGEGIPVYDPDTMTVTYPEAATPDAIYVPPADDTAGYPTGMAPQGVVIPLDANVDMGSPAPLSNAVPADVRNRARRVMRNMTTVLQQTTEDQWGTAAAAQIMSDLPTMKAYLSAVPLMQALIDAGAPQEAAEKVIVALETNDERRLYGIRLR